MAKIKGSGGNDRLFGTNKADHISGRGGNDTIFGRGGNDKISGDDGDDKNFGGAGNDWIHGGKGNDKIFGGSGNDKISGGKGNDTIYGGDGNDRIDGGKGDDFIDGGDGNDRIDGGKGDDTIYGGAGNDRIKGGSGDDLITGGAGADKLTGNSGNDHFIYLANSDSPAGWGWDRITDFTQGHDKIDLVAFREAGDLVWNDGNGATEFGVWFTNSGNSTFVFADTNGDSTADLKIELKHTPGLDLTVNDFIGVSEGNNSPVITSGAQSGSAIEIADLASGENATLHTAAGAVSFTDADTLDTHSATFAPQAGSYLGTFALDPADSPAVTGNAVGWTFEVDDSVLDSLQAGQVLTQKYDVSVSDGHGGTAMQTVTLTLTGTNDAPVTADDAASATEASGVANATAGVDPTGNVLTNDTDVDSGDSKTVTTPGSFIGVYGTLTLDADGSYSYAVNNADAAVNALRTAGDTLTDTFGYTMKDTAGATSTANLVIAIHGANDAPVAVIDNVITNVPQGTGIVIPAFALLANDTDAENDPLSVGTVANPAANDAVSLTLGGDVTYTDNFALDGSDGFFDYKASDGGLDSAFAGVTVDTQVGNTVNGTENSDILIAKGIADSVNTLNAGGGNDFLFGNIGVDALHGGDGDDFLFGGAGDLDELFGDAGNDVLNGDAGFDVLYGGDGDDTLIGGGGDDFLFGGDGSLSAGSGKDVFKFDALPELFAMGDAIIDFEKGPDDLDLHDLMTSIGAPHDSTAFGSYLQFTYTTPGFAGGDTLVQVNKDGAGFDVGDSYMTLVTILGVELTSADTGDYIL